MNKIIITTVLSVALAFGISTRAMAYQSGTNMIITHPERGITEGDCEEKFPVGLSPRASFVDFVGIDRSDMGPWEHGVRLSGAVGIVYSYYINRKYWHGSSVLGSHGFRRSNLVKANKKSMASVITIWTDGNHAYWHVDQNRK